MRLLLAVVVIFSAAWGGYWFWGASQTEAQLRGWFAARDAEGWLANYEDLNTIGFPNRFDTTITEPELADPDTGLAWSAPFLQILSLSYRPNHVILVWPDMQRIASVRETIDITTEQMRASALVRPEDRLALDRITLESGPLTLVSTAGWEASATSAQLALREAPARPLTYDVALDLREASPPAAWAELVGRSGIATPDLGEVTFQAAISFDAPWDLDAVERARPQPTRIEIGRAKASWGALELQARGDLRVGAGGTLQGDLTLRATNWQPMLALAVESGALPGELANVIENGLTLLAQFSGNPNNIDVPLSFQRGTMTLGGLVPLGPAPRLVLR